MKKERIAELLFFVAVFFFLIICICTRTEEPVKEVWSGTAAPESTETPGEGADPETGIPSVGQAEEENANKQDMSVTVTPAGESDTVSQNSNPNTSNLQPGPTVVPASLGKLPGAIEIKNENYEQYSNELNAWWFIRKEDHSPSGSGEGFPIVSYSGYYRDTHVTEEDKVVYLTFDCGYENGFTPTILDTLAEKNVKAMFFVTKDFVAKNAEYVKRMKEEGHLVGNHTVRHLSSPSLTPEELDAEFSEVAKTMYELTGYQMDPFFRPPMGEYSERTLKATKDMGYASIFWSIAYYDYDVNNQPGKAYVVDHFDTYHHNGAIVLMHNTSQSNAEALPEVVELLKAERYRFGELTEVIGEQE